MSDKREDLYNARQSPILNFDESQIMHSREQKQFYEAVLEDPKVRAALQYVEGIDNRLQFLADEFMPELIRIVKADETLAKALIGEARIEPTTDPASATPKYLCNLLEKMALDIVYRQKLAEL